MTKSVLGIIGGSGVYDLPGLQNVREERIASPWGESDAENSIYLTDAALEILKSLPRLKDCKYVFSTTGDSASSGFSKAQTLLDKIAPSKAWRLHDLRRTFSTSLVPLGPTEITIEKCLNHTLKGPLAVYNRHPYTAEKKAAWEI